MYLRVSSGEIFIKGERKLVGGAGVGLGSAPPPPSCVTCVISHLWLKNQLQNLNEILFFLLPTEK